MTEERQVRKFTCSKCGAEVEERDVQVDENGRRVLNCPECQSTIYRKRLIPVARPLPDHLSKRPDDRFTKRPV